IMNLAFGNALGTGCRYCIFLPYCKLNKSQVLLFKRNSDLNEYIAKKRAEGIKIGFVPTMGALHAGHISLIKLSRNKAEITICSIFVNPTPFNDPSDYEKYPNTLRSDVDLLANAGCDVLFLPTITEIYPEGAGASKSPIPLDGLDQQLEGTSRPGHFQGVAQVVKRLLDLVKPELLILGQKDFQQVLIIKKMIRHFQIPVDIIQGAIIREPNGLAMSSRNLRLSRDAREKAGVIYEALSHVKEHYGKIECDVLIARAKEMILEKLEGATIDYLLIADSETLMERDSNNNREKVLLAAVWVEGVRLLDNIILTNE
ncbi:MAG: pantoate--beta-alanine ligase, partial [Bacteroidota bacterium]